MLRFGKNLYEDYIDVISLGLFRAGLDQESRSIFPLQILKSGSLIGRRIEANPDEFRLGVKAITKY
jgi:hypothetical protein